MHFEAGNYYHIYNRGIDRCTIFFTKNNYQHFINKIVKYIAPHCSIVAWCLMPNHFHLLIYADYRSELRVLDKSPIERSVMSEGIRMALSSYSKAINKQRGRVGNLFQQKTKQKLLNATKLSTSNNDYLENCFEYIHFNPVEAGLVEEPEEWEFSSYNQYFKISPNPICDLII